MSLPLKFVDLVDLVIAIALIELALLVLYRLRTGRGIALHDFVANMVAGLCLMGALRELATDAGTLTIAAWLLAAGVAHGTDIVMRWRRAATLNTTVKSAGNAPGNTPARALTAAHGAKGLR